MAKTKDDIQTLNDLRNTIWFLNEKLIMTGIFDIATRTLEEKRYIKYYYGDNIKEFYGIGDESSTETTYHSVFLIVENENRLYFLIEGSWFLIYNFETNSSYNDYLKYPRKIEFTDFPDNYFPFYGNEENVANFLNFLKTNATLGEVISKNPNELLINGKKLGLVNGKKVRAIHYGLKTFYPTYEEES